MDQWVKCYFNLIYLKFTHSRVVSLKRCRLTKLSRGWGEMCKENFDWHSFSVCVFEIFCVSAVLFEIKTMPFPPVFDQLTGNSGCGGQRAIIWLTLRNVSPPLPARGHTCSTQDSCVWWTIWCVCRCVWDSSVMKILKKRANEWVILRWIICRNPE